MLASGGVSLLFSWREIQSHLVALQMEKAQGAATRIKGARRAPTFYQLLGERALDERIERLVTRSGDPAEVIQEELAEHVARDVAAGRAVEPFGLVDERLQFGVDHGARLHALDAVLRGSQRGLGLERLAVQCQRCRPLFGALCRDSS